MNVIAGAAAPVRDSEHDIVETLVGWITEQKGPERILASRIGSNGEVVAQRPWCAYP